MVNIIITNRSDEDLLCCYVHTWYSHRITKINFVLIKQTRVFKCCSHHEDQSTSFEFNYSLIRLSVKNDLAVLSYTGFFSFD